MTKHRKLLERWYPEVRFGGFTDVDGMIRFYGRVNAVLDPSFVVLDLGCGRGAAAEDPVRWRRDLRTLKGKCGLVYGADIDPSAAANPLIDSFVLVEDGCVPLPDETIDLCVSDSVLEHVKDVDLFFAECARLIRPGGFLFIRTPNVWNYASLVSRLVPNRLHPRVLSLAQQDRKAEDVFPTFYRCNTVGKLDRALERHAFDAVVTTTDAEPAYLSLSRILYAVGVLHQRYAPAALRGTILVYARKLPHAPSRG